jgi:alkylated DNA repair dioxygenase AlkB
MDNLRKTNESILPCDGDVFYLENVFSEQDSTRIYAELLATIPWSHDELLMFGKLIVTKRQMAWYAEDDLTYTYSGSKKVAHAFIEPLSTIKKKVEHILGCSFNSCLLNYYANGDQSMGWHCDNERELYPDSSSKINHIASLSFGAKRRFDFRHKETKETVSIDLHSGSVVFMVGITQQFWKHQLPKIKSIKDGRINLTFRNIFKNRV